MNIEPEMAYGAVQALGEVGPDAAPAATKLTALLSDPDLFPTAATALAKIGPPAEAVVSALLAQFGSEKRIFTATGALRKIKPDAVLPALYEQLKNPDHRYAALEAIAELDKDAGPAIPVLLKALSREDTELKIAAMETLGRLKKVAAPAVKDIVPYLADENLELRRAAVWAIKGIKAQPEVCIPALLPALNHSDRLLRIQAATALGEFKAAEAVDPLRKWLSDPKLQSTAIYALKEIGPAAKSAAPELVKFLASEDDEQAAESLYLRQAAFDALAAMGPDIASNVPELLKLRKTAAPILRRKIGEAIWKIDPSAAKNAGIPEPANTP